MVLVSDKLRNDTGLLQTKLRHREGYEARRVGLETVPLDQHNEGSHGERESRLRIGPDSVHDLFTMADECQQGEHRLHEDAILPLPRRHSLRLVGAPSAAWKAVSLRIIMRSSHCRMSQ
jgi:hypothetical protein